MLVMGVDHALLWAVGAFFLSFVPYIGLLLALIPPTILAFAETGLFAAAVIVVGGGILNVVAENVLEPSLTGKALSLSTCPSSRCSSCGSGSWDPWVRCCRCRSRC